MVIDHDMTLLRSVCSRFVALDLGEVIATGTADEVQAHPRVIEAFLGTTGAAERSRDLSGSAPTRSRSRPPPDRRSRRRLRLAPGAAGPTMGR